MEKQQQASWREALDKLLTYAARYGIEPIKYVSDEDIAKKVPDEFKETVGRASYAKLYHHYVALSLKYFKPKVVSGNMLYYVMVPTCVVRNTTTRRHVPAVNSEYGKAKWLFYTFSQDLAEVPELGLRRIARPELGGIGGRRDRHERRESMNKVRMLGIEKHLQKTVPLLVNQLGSIQDAKDNIASYGAGKLTVDGQEVLLTDAVANRSREDSQANILKYQAKYQELLASTTQIATGNPNTLKFFKEQFDYLLDRYNSTGRYSDTWLQAARAWKAQVVANFEARIADRANKQNATRRLTATA